MELDIGRGPAREIGGGYEEEGLVGGRLRVAEVVVAEVAAGDGR